MSSINLFVKENITAYLGQIEISSKDASFGKKSFDQTVVVGGEIMKVVDFGNHLIVTIDDSTGSADVHIVEPLLERFSPYVSIGKTFLFEGRLHKTTSQKLQPINIYAVDFTPEKTIIHSS